jgi:CPA2 family monovalent cation:H+ antiporter-2
MSHLPVLIQDLCVILVTAALVSLVFKRLKQPVVLGYLIAGVLVGPHINFLPTVREIHSVEVWAEIGVIFLLFGLGLEFSFKKLAKVGKSASISALFEILTMGGVGYIVGQALGWTRVDSIFLGAILAMSSTTIIVRAFDELGLKGKSFVSLVFGILIVEDLAAILIMVLLGTLATSDGISGGNLLFLSLRLGFFLLLWFLIGIYVLPVFLKKARTLLSDETLLIVSIGLCLSMVLLASGAGFSPALGAFIMGSILAETSDGHRIDRLLIPVRDLFAAIFFVSVGMMINPAVLWDNAGVVFLLTIVTIVGKLFGSGLGALLSGRSLKQSLQAGMSLAQIGEFSFIIATLGVTMKVTSDFLYPIVVAVSAVTTFTTPYMIKASDPISAWIESRLPASFLERLKRYEAAMASDSGKNILMLFWEQSGMKVILNLVMVVAIGLGMRLLALPKVTALVGDPSWVPLAMAGVSLAISTPFIWAIVVGAPARSSAYISDRILQIRSLQFGFFIVRILIGVLLTGFIVSQFMTLRTFSGVMLIGLAVLAVFFGKYAEPMYRKVEGRFLQNLNAKEMAELASKPNQPELAPWSATLAEFVLSPFSELAAKTLEESAIKEKAGVTITMIERSGLRILAPGRYDRLLPHDRLFVIGTDEQLDAVRPLIETKAPDVVTSTNENFGLDSISIDEHSRFINQTIRECGIREETSGLIVGIERDGKRILNPDSSLRFNPGDRVWIVGDRKKIKLLRSQAQSGQPSPQPA